MAKKITKTSLGLQLSNEFSLDDDKESDKGMNNRSFEISFDPDYEATSGIHQNDKITPQVSRGNKLTATVTKSNQDNSKENTSNTRCVDEGDTFSQSSFTYTHVSDIKEYNKSNSKQNSNNSTYNTNNMTTPLESQVSFCYCSFDCCCLHCHGYCQYVATSVIATATMITTLVINGLNENEDDGGSKVPIN